jgi:hypothetical protein
MEESSNKPTIALPFDSDKDTKKSGNQTIAVDNVL